MALYFYRNLLTNALVYSDQPSPPEGNGDLELIGEQTNMNPGAKSDWVFDDMRSTFVSVEKDDRLIGKIAGLTSMNYMFSNCSALTGLDLSGFDTSEVTNMHAMFSACSGLTNLDLSGLDTSKVTSMNSMFANCSSLTSPDLSGFDTSQVKGMDYMFMYCSGLTSLDLSGFDTSQAKNTSGMFDGCSSLTALDLSGFDTSKVAYMVNMLRGCNSLRLLAISGSMSNVLARLPASQYYPASGGDPVAKASLTAGTWVRDEPDLSKVATLVEQAQAFAALRRDAGRLEKRIAALEKAAG